MRIGIDMVAVQSPWSRLRGIGRLGHNLVAALLAYDTANEYFLYTYEGLPDDRVPASANASVVTLLQDQDHGEARLGDVIDRLARTNPDGLDVLLLLSPLELYGGYAPPSPPLNGLKLASVVHDVIPFLFQENYLTEPPHAMPVYRSLETLRLYDVLLSNSDATRADFLRLLGMANHQVVTIGCASEGDFFRPDRTDPMPEDSAAVLHSLGIDRPFIFNLGGMDEQNDRKNLFGLIDAFRFLPSDLRASHQLVLSCFMNDRFIARIRKFAAERGVEEQLVLTNEVSDEILRVLYQRCALFAFPSFYEGFGLPLLEAMQCGAPVVAGNNSSQVEVVGEGGLLVNVHDAADIADKIARVLTDPELARDLGARALEQSRQFRWEKTAERTVRALEAASSSKTRSRQPLSARRRAHRTHAARPRIAVFSPFPPKVSGISDYATRLVHQLKDRYAIDLYHDLGYVPDLGLGSHEFGCFDFRLFERNAALIDYRAILYQMGNSVYHKFVYDTLWKHPGIVTLHDFCLSAFHYWYAHLPGSAPDYFERVLSNFCSGRAEELIAQIPDWALEPGGVQVACARRGLYLNRLVFELATSVVVHSPWCVDQMRALFSEHEPRTTLIPMGATPRALAAEERAAVRARFNLPADAPLCASFGILSKGKMNEEAIEAFAPLAAVNPAALLLFVGQDWEQGEAKHKAEELGLESRVRFLGRQPMSDFTDLIAVTDIGIALRRPPTDGETSASLLDLLRMGVATIVTDVGTFSGYPDHIVRKVKWEAEGLDGLKAAVRELADDPARRAALGQAAFAYVSERHDWSLAAAQYEALIERSHAKKMHKHGPEASILRGPHRAHVARTQQSRH
ncbi:MAG TPA: glycosyltransferase [Isosphaeraceae bacterium]|jgi:glycosyltransferase involved in cell wall biosynthesis|nr:glycosyltransferase [Isosphaeraceae bacterium]